MPDTAHRPPSPKTEGRAHASELTVKARRNGADWSFELQADGKATAEVTYSKDALGLHKRDWHEADFMLDDPSGALAFHPDKFTAIWVARGTAAAAPPYPMAPSRDHGVVPLSSRPKRLRVRNDNAEPCLLSFRLNFVAAEGPGDTIVAFLDPIMNNQNGGSGSRN
ncbi:MULTISPECIES: hypothetical protein [Sphingomonas]|uniref:hypothetical protein n=1 Tax=Sphingomonas TaxID=13687 RepID=UPI000DEF7D18|nr:MULTISPECIES: hypothetical protein [Sphingomonas]